MLDLFAVDQAGEQTTKNPYPGLFQFRQQRWQLSTMAVGDTQQPQRVYLRSVGFLKCRYDLFRRGVAQVHSGPPGKDGRRAKVPPEWVLRSIACEPIGAMSGILYRGKGYLPTILLARPLSKPTQRERIPC